MEHLMEWKKGFERIENTLRLTMSGESKWLQSLFAWKLELVESELNFKTTKFFCQHCDLFISVSFFFAAYRYFYSFSFSPSFFLRTSITKVRPSWVSFFLHLRISIALFFFSCRPTHSSSFKQNGWFVSLLFARKISKSK